MAFPVQVIPTLTLTSVGMMLFVAEKQFQDAVIQAALTYGWDFWHVSDARRTVKGKTFGDTRIAGWPDLTLAHPERGLLFLELKDHRGVATPKQIETIGKLDQAARLGGQALIVRPNDLQAITRFLCQRR